jgi:transposase InsO family protein
VVINRKRTQRLHTEEGLTVRKRKSRRRAIGARAAPPVVALPNQRWSLDFVHDQLASGRRFRVLNVVDDVTRECLAAVVDTSISGKRVVRELADLVAWRGKPGMIVSDNGSGLTWNAVLSWCGETGIGWHHIAPGKRHARTHGWATRRRPSTRADSDWTPRGRWTRRTKTATATGSWSWPDGSLGSGHQGQDNLRCLPRWPP